MNLKPASAVSTRVRRSDHVCDRRVLHTCSQCVAVPEDGINVSSVWRGGGVGGGPGTPGCPPCVYLGQAALLAPPLARPGTDRGLMDAGLGAGPQRHPGG